MDEGTVAKGAEGVGMKTIPEVASVESEKEEDDQDEKEMSLQDETGDDVQRVQKEGSRKDEDGNKVEEKEGDDIEKCEEEEQEGKEHGATCVCHLPPARTSPESFQSW